MIDSDVKCFMHETMKDIKCGLIKGERLEDIEERTFYNLNISWKDASIISGFNRTNRESKNRIELKKNSKFVFIINILDGQVNYLRGSSGFGFSISVVDLCENEDYSIVYDGVNGIIIPCEELFKLSVNIKKDQNVEKTVLALGGMYKISDESHNIASRCSLRSLGSTSLTLLEIARHHIDIFITKTKLWNIWWAVSFARNCNMTIEDIDRNTSFIECSRNYLENPEQSIKIACFTSRQIRDKFDRVLCDI